MGKVSVAILMGRLMSPNRWRRWVLYFLAISTFIAACIVIIFIFAQCSPPKTLWIPTAGTCWNPSITNHLDVALSSAYQVLYGFDLWANSAKRLVRICRFCPCGFRRYDDLESSIEHEKEGWSECLSRLGDLVRIFSSVWNVACPSDQFSRPSASICAAVKTSYLPTLTARSDFTCTIPSFERGLKKIDGNLGITVDLLIWNA